MERQSRFKLSSAALVVIAALFGPTVIVAQFPTTAPAPAPIKAAQFPPFQEATLANGLHLLVVHNDKQPVVAVSLSFSAGSVYDPAGKSGVADMLAGLLTKGAGKRSAEEISAAIEGVGAGARGATRLSLRAAVPQTTAPPIEAVIIGVFLACVTLVSPTSQLSDAADADTPDAAGVIEPSMCRPSVPDRRGE